MLHVKQAKHSGLGLKGLIRELHQEHMPVVYHSPSQQLRGICEELYTLTDIFGPAPRKHVAQEKRHKKVLEIGCCYILCLLVGREQAKRCHHLAARLQASHGFLQQHTLTRVPRFSCGLPFYTR